MERACPSCEGDLDSSTVGNAVSAAFMASSGRGRYKKNAGRFLCPHCRTPLVVGMQFLLPAAGTFGVLGIWAVLLLGLTKLPLWISDSALAMGLSFVAAIGLMMFGLFNMWPITLDAK